MIDPKKIKEKGSIKIIVKTGAKKSSVNGYDKERSAYIISITAKPVNNKANLALIKFFKKEYSLDMRIAKGVSCKEKILRVL